MASLITDDQGQAKPQYETDDGQSFESHKGKNGAVYVYEKDGHNETMGAKADAEAATGDGSVIAILKGVRGFISSIKTAVDSIKAKSDTYHDKSIKAESVVGAVSVTTTATELMVGASAKASRSQLLIHNNGSEVLYIGFGSSITTTDGFPIAAGQTHTVELNPNTSIPVFAIVETGPVDVRIIEV